MKSLIVVLHCIVALGLACCAGCTSSGAMYAAMAATPAPSAADAVPASMPLPEARELANRDVPSAKPGAKRLMIYNGALTLLVDNIGESLDAVRKTVEQAGGYMHSMDSCSITVKIPAAKFRDITTTIEKLGDVTHKNITGRDVTDKMRDLNIRLKNAEAIRKRLVALLERAEKVEDALAIERELGRLTEKIELLKGQIAALEDKVAFSTLTVRFNSPVPQKAKKEGIPFSWVRNLGAEMLHGLSGVRQTRRGKHVSFDMPESFAKYSEWSYTTRAVSAEGVIIKVQRRRNVEGADLQFWTKLARRALTDQRAMKLQPTRDIKMRKDDPGKLLEGVKEIGGEKYGYIVAIAQTEKRVYVYEAWGRLPELEEVRESIEESIRTMKIGGLF